MDINSEIYRRIEADYGKGYRVINAVLEDGTQRKLRLGKTEGGVMMYMAKGKKNRGYYLTSLNIVDYALPKMPDIKRQWERSIDRAIEMLEQSGLWAEKLRDLKTARAVGYEKIQEACMAYDDCGEGGISYAEQRKKNAERIRQIDSRLLTEDGRVNTEILWYMSRPLKIKKMNFEQYGNEAILEKIKEAIANKKDYCAYGHYQYDKSFEYNAEMGKAWYSEEYRGCGNGHYYLALNGTHALFYEDD